MSTYQYTLNLAGSVIYQAFSDYIQNLYPTTFVLYTANDGVTIFLTFNQPMDADQLETLQTQVSSFVNPPYYLVFDHVENHCLATPQNLTIVPIVMQTMIMSQTMQTNGIGGQTSYLANMKTVAEIDLPNVASLSNLDPTVTPVNFTLTMQDITRTVQIASVTTDISSVISGWLAGTITDPTYHSTQIYGLYGMFPDYDTIVQILGNVNIPNIGLKLNSLQKIYFNVLTS